MLKEISILLSLVNIASGTHTLQIKNKEMGKVVAVVSMAGSVYVNINSVVTELNKLTRQRYGILFCNF